MLILECVEQKKECRGQKWGGLLPISNLGSRHCSGVATGRTMESMVGALACTTEDPHAPARVCLGRHVATSLLGCSVVIEMAYPLSRQRI